MRRKRSGNKEREEIGDYNEEIMMTTVQRDERTTTATDRESREEDREKKKEKGDERDFVTC